MHQPSGVAIIFERETLYDEVVQEVVFKKFHHGPNFIKIPANIMHTELKFMSKN